MMADPECAKWVNVYAASNDLFFEDFIKMFSKMSVLGCDDNPAVRPLLKVNTKGGEDAKKRLQRVTSSRSMPSGDNESYVTEMIMYTTGAFMVLGTAAAAGWYWYSRHGKRG